MVSWTEIMSGFCCVSCVPASCVHIWFVSCPCFMSLWVNLCPAVCMWLCVNYPVYISPVFWVWFGLVYLLLPGVSVHVNHALSCLDGSIKGAVCRILTLLKHKNTIICLQTFRKHAKLTYLFIWKTMLQSVILLWKCAVRPGMSVCYGLWNPSTASLPNCISAPWVASCRKTQRI